MNQLTYENWDNIIRHLDLLPHDSPIPRMLLDHLQKPKFKPNTINIYIEKNKVICNGVTLDLSNRSRMIDIFKVFINSEKKKIKRKELINKVYGTMSNSSISYRQLECHNHNIVKLMSRARNLADKFFNNIEGNAYDWFAYDPCSKTWTLFKIRDDE